jgi:hypothetical protein
MNTTQLFETTLYDETFDVALGVVSVPTKYSAHSGGEHPLHVLTGLGLRPVGEIPSDRLSDAITSILAAGDVWDATDWLSEPPDPVSLEFSDDLVYLRPASGDFDSTRVQDQRDGLETRGPAEMAAPVPRLRKGDPRAEEVRSFARAATTDAFVPFQKSPLDIYAISDVLTYGEDIRALLVTPRSNPYILIMGAAGLLIFYPVLGVAQGLHRGLQSGIAAGVKYRVLRKYGLPDDIIRDQMKLRDDE